MTNPTRASALLDELHTRCGHSAVEGEACLGCAVEAVERAFFDVEVRAVRETWDKAIASLRDTADGSPPLIELQHEGVEVREIRGGGEPSAADPALASVGKLLRDPECLAEGIPKLREKMAALIRTERDDAAREARAWCARKVTGWLQRNLDEDSDVAAVQLISALERGPGAPAEEGQ